MTKLQKDSLINFILVTVSMLISIACFTLMRKFNTRGVEYVVIVLVSGSICGLAGMIFVKKHFRYLDERQLLLCLKASRLSAYTFVIYIIALCMIVFFIIGGKGKIDVYYLPVAAFIGLFLSQLVETSMLFFADTVE